MPRKSARPHHLPRHHRHHGGSESTNGWSRASEASDYIKIGKVVAAIAAALIAIAGGMDIRWGQSASADKLDAIGAQIESLSEKAHDNKELLTTISRRQEDIHKRVRVLEKDKGEADRREALRKIVQEELWAESARKYRSAQESAAGSE